jgi:hypothetical protein
MRDILSRTGIAAIAAGLALAVSACGDSEQATDDAANNMIDANALFDEPANDASAMESVTNVEEPLPEIEAGNASETENVLGETSGGDTGGNTVDSNVSGM